jgi:DNA-binding NarL/FixJ family response regulator
MSSSGARTVSKPKRHQPAEKPVRVLICAASSVTRAGLERQLAPQSSLQVVGGITTTNGLRPAIAEGDPDVVFLQLDGQLREMRWEELIVLGVAIVLLAESVDLVGAAAAIAGGVQAILVGDVTGAELATAAASAASGLLMLSGDFADLVRQGLLVHSPEDADSYAGDLAHIADNFPEHLTQREREVLEMMSEGLCGAFERALRRVCWKGVWELLTAPIPSWNCGKLTPQRRMPFVPNWIWKSP